MGKNSRYIGTVDVNVQEAIDSLNNHEQKELFLENLEYILTLEDALSCYTESELLEYIAEKYQPSDIFEQYDY